MAFIAPLGRVSAINTPEGTYHIQTEFALRPEPRVTTTVIFNGKVVHKDNYTCSPEILEEASRDLLDTILAEQHKKVKESWQREKGASHKATKPEKSPAPVDKSQQTDIIRENLEKIKGIKEVVVLDPASLRKPTKFEASLYSTGYENLVSKVLNFALEIQNLSRLGSVKEARGVWQSAPFLILGNLSPALALFLEKDVEFSAVQTQIQIVLAKYYAE